MNEAYAWNTPKCKQCPRARDVENFTSNRNIEEQVDDSRYHGHSETHTNGGARPEPIDPPDVA